MDEKKFICTIPYTFTEVYLNRQTLCCPAWLPNNVNDGKGVLSSFFSDEAKKVRESIEDGSYKYCDKKACPYLSALINGIYIDSRFKLKDNKKDLHPSLDRVNLCVDDSCNLKCPSCRNDFVNYTGDVRKKIDEKLLNIKNEINPYVKIINLSGTCELFYSTSMRNFLIGLDVSKFKRLGGIRIHTNAQLWNEKRWNEFKHLHPYITSCEISIDAASEETYNKVRLGGSWERLLNNLDFILNIPTIKHFAFSMVVQRANYMEMRKFYDMIKNLMPIQKGFTVFYNSISNWTGNDDYNDKNVADVNHEEHLLFLRELKKIQKLPNIETNLNHLFQFKKTLI